MTHSIILSRIACTPPACFDIGQAIGLAGVALQGASLFGSKGGGGGGGGFKPLNTKFQTPKFSINVGQGVELVDKDPGLTLARKQSFGRLIDEVSSARGDVRPGFGRLTEAVVQSIREAADKSRGDLRQQLAQRRVSGASFANDVVTRSDVEFAQAESQLRSQALIAEIGLTSELITQEFGFRRVEIEDEFRELQLVANVGKALLGINAANEQFAQQIAIAAAGAGGEAFGSFTESLGNLGSTIFKDVSFGDIFGGSSSPGSAILAAGVNSGGPTSGGIPFV